MKRDINEIGRSLFESLFRSYIEDGTIEVSDRLVEEIFADFHTLLLKLASDPGLDNFTIAPTLDHRRTLLETAAREAAAGNDGTAITLYMTWAEHFVNGLLVLAFQRRGYESTVYMPLIRELRLATKASSVWSLLGLPEISSDHLKLLERGANMRNAFVHYKWSSLSIEEADRNRRQLRSIVEQMEGLVVILAKIEAQEIWNGRENELIGYLRNLTESHEREVGSFSEYLNGLT
ncbi:hypothetical protein [Microbispora hainanensis]|uniref:hypothetical protein n=1 Tax=Microbispora hainanensis TaxID=568844 RepID=UPI003256631A